MLKHCGFVYQTAFGKARQVEGAGVDQFGVAAQDEVREDAAGGRGMHDAMAAEAVGKVQTWDLGNTSGGSPALNHRCATRKATARVACIALDVWKAPG